MSDPAPFAVPRTPVPLPWPTGARRGSQHGFIRGVFRHPASRLWVGLAILVHILLQFSPLWVPAVERRTAIEICTADGIRLVPAVPKSGSPAGKKKLAGECVLCALHNTAVLAPETSALVFLPARAGSTVQAPDGIDPGKPLPRSGPLARAPPILS